MERVRRYIKGLGYYAKPPGGIPASDLAGWVLPSAVTGIEYTIVASLPATGEAGVIYLIANSGSGQNIYDEYIWVNNAFEKIGTTEIDISGKENTSNKVTSLSSSSADTQYPSAKCIWDLVGDIETLLAAI